MNDFFGLLDKYTPKMRFRFINNEKIQPSVKTKRKCDLVIKKAIRSAQWKKNHDSEKQTKKTKFKRKKRYKNNKKKVKVKKAKKKKMYIIKKKKE